MRGHEHDFDEVSEGTHGRQAPDPEQVGQLYKAAAAGRADVVGPSRVGSLQRAVGNRAVGAMLAEEKAEEPAEDAAAPRSSVHDVVGSGGEAMDAETRSDMESRLGADFGDVRIHRDGRAHESAKDVGAHAYTVGNNVVFQRDAYDPSSHAGKTMLAHELTHVVQQRSGPVDGTETSGGIRVSDPSDRFEREAVANAERVMGTPESSQTPGTDSVVSPGTGTVGTGTVGTGTVGTAPVQRAVDESAVVQRAGEEDEDEEPADVQGMFVQRAAEEEEEEPSVE